MESALGWLGDFIRAVGRLVPRLEIIKSTHSGVAFVRGKHPKAMRPGLRWWWPVWTEIITYPVVRQSINLPAQTLTTLDDESVTASGVVIYKITNITKALTEQWDLSSTISDLSLCAIREYICSADFHATNRNRKEADRTLTQAVKDVLSPYGIRVLSAMLTDFAKCKVITIVNPGEAQYITDGDEDEDK